MRGKMEKCFYDGHGELLGIRQESGDKVYLYDAHGALKGIYYTKTDQTYDPSGNLVGFGDLLMTLI